MTNNEFELELAKHLNCSQTYVSEKLDAFIATYKEALTNGDSCKLSDIGLFETKKTAVNSTSGRTYTVSFEASHTTKGKLRNLLQ